MTEETDVRTGTDLDIEQLNERMDQLEASYKDRIAELEEANRGLWERLHATPVVTEAPPTTEAVPDDGGYQALSKALGLHE